MMKIAVPTREGVVDSHFGHCESYTVFTIDADKKISNVDSLPSPQGCGCKSNIAGVMQEMGVKVMLAGNMGAGAVNVLNSHGIQVFRGCAGDVRAVADQYLAGNIQDSGSNCEHHHDHEGGSCGNH